MCIIAFFFYCMWRGRCVCVCQMEKYPPKRCYGGGGCGVADCETPFSRFPWSPKKTFCDVSVMKLWRFTTSTLSPRSEGAERRSQRSVLHSDRRISGRYSRAIGGVAIFTSRTSRSTSHCSRVRTRNLCHATRSDFGPTLFERLPLVFSL